jgi:dolichol kinase
MKPILRGHEIDNDKSVFTGGTYITIAFLICVIIFPKQIAITAMFVVIFCDSFAAIAGKSIGKHFIANKTLEGSLAFFVTGVIIIILTPKVTDSITEYYIGFIAILLSTIFELIPLKIDDNISTPIFFGLVYLLLLKIFL